MTRGGRGKTSDEPERRCIVTRESGPKTGLIRFVAGPGDEVVPDIAGRLPGRGMWVSADRAALVQAAGKGAFAKVARRPLKAPADLADQVESLLAARLVVLVALARKAGQAVAGFEKTKDALVSGEAAVLLQAADGSERERGRLRPPGDGIEGENRLVSCLFGHELGLAFARDRVIHAAVLAGGLGDRIRIEGLRLSGIRITSNQHASVDVAGDGSAGEGLRGKG